MERSRAVASWSGALAALGIGAATLIATLSSKPLANPWFIVSVIVAAGASTILVAAGIPDLAAGPEA